MFFPHQKPFLVLISKEGERESKKAHYRLEKDEINKPHLSRLLLQSNSVEPAYILCSQAAKTNKRERERDCLLSDEKEEPMKAFFTVRIRNLKHLCKSLSGKLHVMLFFTCDQIISYGSSFTFSYILMAGVLEALTKRSTK